MGPPPEVEVLGVLPVQEETEMEALRPAVEEEVVRDPPVVVPVPVVITEVLDPALEVPDPVLVVATMVMVTIIGKILKFIKFK
jgi:hypothetical protein